ncbi:MAG: dephospho-CoA kinase [Ginsengibacter sp.]
MLKVGLTGGMGSGKTTVARIFQVMGIPVFYADAEAKKLMEEDFVLRENIINALGTESYTGSQPNRKYMAQQVFSDPEKLTILNSLIHPAIIAQAEKWMKCQSSPFAIKEAAILFESNSHKKLDFVIGVESPEDLRISRSIERDNLSKDQVKSRMARQMSQVEKMKLCDFVIINDERHSLIEQVLSIYNILLNKK